MLPYTLVTRDDWGARPPEREIALSWGRVTEFVVHHSGAARIQTVKSIQRYCMDTKGHSDIDYNYLVRNLDLYIGRGNNVGSHNLNRNSIGLGVCIIGEDGDATDADFATVRALYDEICRNLGRALNMVGHQQTQRPGYTDCPGSQIQQWINAGMPYPKKAVNMFFLQVDGKQEIYSSDGVHTRLMLPGTWETTVAPLEAAGVPRLTYHTLEDLIKGGGPLATTPPAGGGAMTIPQPFQVQIIDVPTT